jgi:predicted GNAT superfamily acetyltransferase
MEWVMNSPKLESSREAGTQESGDIIIRPIEHFDDFKAIAEVEKLVWGLSDEDVLPVTFIVASQAAGASWIGAFSARRLVGFAFGFMGRENGVSMIHSHMLAVLPNYRDHEVGRRLKIAQRESVLAMGIPKITWTFDPLQGKNAHLNFTRLGVVSCKYKVNFYGPETSSSLHRNGTDRLWVDWNLDTPQVLHKLSGHESRHEILDALKNLTPLVRFDGTGSPVRTDLSEALQRQRIAIEIPCDIGALEAEDPDLARAWRAATRWAFCESLKHDFVVTEFCRSVRGNQGPGTYVLERPST